MKMKQYNEDNKEHLIAYHKKHNAIDATCACGSTYKKCNTVRHEKTTKHINYLANHITEINDRRNI